MSTTSNQYLILGVKLPHRNGDDHFEHDEPYHDNAFKGIHHHNGLCVVCDGMNGKYTFIGRVLQKSEEGDRLDGPLEIPAPEPVLVETVKSLIELSFKIMNPDVKLWFVTHYR